MRRILAALLVLTASSAIAETRSMLRGGARAPILVIDSNDGPSPVVLSAIDIHVLVRGHLARTTWELTYRNNLPREISATLAFPLPATAEVSDLGLYFGEKLRHAAVVERVQARAAYEQTVHRRVDPALAEWSSGRAFRLRVYPIPARGTKTVHIAYDQEIPSGPYELALPFADNIESSKITIDAEDQKIESSGVTLTRAGAQWVLRQTGMPLSGSIRIHREEDDDRAIAAWSTEDSMWYASAPLKIRPKTQGVAAASQIVVLWDASASSARADRTRVVAFLDELLAQQATNARAIVVPFHIDVEAAIPTDRASLRTVIESLDAAGATDLGGLLDKLPSLLRAAAPDARVVLVTDGIQMMGTTARMNAALQRAASLHRSLVVVSATDSPDDRMLSRITEVTRGWRVDLSSSTASDAAAFVMRAVRPVTLRAAGPALSDVAPESFMPGANATVVVNERSTNPIMTFAISTGGAIQTATVRTCRDCGDLVRRAWARSHLATLLTRSAGGDVIRAHGIQFGQVTPQTSLLILDSWRDYEMYGLAVPEDLRRQRAIDIQSDKSARQKSQQTDQAASAPSTMAMRGVTSEQPPGPAAWFLKGRVLYDDAPLPGVTITLTPAIGERQTAVSNAEGWFWISAQRAPETFTLKAELTGMSSVTQRYNNVPNRSTVEINMRIAAVAEAITVTAVAREPADSDVSEAASDDVRVSLVAPSPGALADELLRSLATGNSPGKVAVANRREAIGKVIEKLASLPSPADRFRYYIAARSVLGGEKRFHARAAAALHDSDRLLAIRAVSDLAEAYPDDAALLRLVGRIIDGWGRSDVARLLIERALELSPRDIQSWRELLALDSRDGDEKQFQQLLRDYRKAEGSSAFRQVAIDLNQELQRAGRAGTDPRLDPDAVIQADVMWDTNFSDVDLHVVEPGGEEVSYQHTESASGGLHHGDVTDGYGPEVYTAPRPAPGEYRIFLDYYAGDSTEVSAETLAHVIVWERGVRSDSLVVLESEKEMVDVMKLRVR